MFERETRPQVFYVPQGPDIDQVIKLGAGWLRQQHGDRLVLLHYKKVYTNNPLLPRLTAGATVATPQSVWNSRWNSGPVLAPWASEKVLSAITDDLADRITAVCVLEWGEDAYVRSWVAAHKGINLLTRETQASRADLLHPVVQVAMAHLSESVNHNNGLVGPYDKEDAVATLQALVRAGYRYDVDALCEWALGHGFTAAEVTRLRDYATRVLAGRTFKLHWRSQFSDGAVTAWERQAADQSNDS